MDTDGPPNETRQDEVPVETPALTEARPDDRFQFSLRTLLFGVLLLCVVLGVRRTPDAAQFICYSIYVGVALAILGLAKRCYRLAVLGCIVIAASVPLHNAYSAWGHENGGLANRTVATTVVDLRTGKPIRGAKVTIACHDFGQSESTVTDANGRATFRWAFYTYGKDYVLWKSESLNIGWHAIQVEADGYVDAIVRLRDILDVNVPVDTEIPDTVIKLERQNTRVTESPSRAP